MPRPSATKSETLCELILEAEGWHYIHSGWPDYLCWRDDEIQFVEAKSHRNDSLSPDQERVLEALASRGLRCFVWSPDRGFVLIESSGESLILPKKKPLGQSDIVNIVGSFAAMKLQQQWPNCLSLPDELALETDSPNLVKQNRTGPSHL